MLQNQSALKLVSLMLQDTGTYNNMVSRPYHAMADANTLDNLGRRIEDVTRVNPLTKINGGLISGLCGQLVVPSANWDSRIHIPNGWNEQRLRFVMEVHYDSHFGTEVYFFQGYTEFKGISLNGTIDPDMVFFINSYIRVNRVFDSTGSYSGGFRDTIVESAQVIDGRVHSTVNSAVYTLRPEDLFTGIQSNYIGSMHDVYGSGNVVDDRINKATDVIKSRRANAVPSNYLSKVVETYRQASSYADFGAGSDDIYSTAIQSSYEGNPYENPFIRTISDLRGMSNITFFTMNDLARIDPTINTRTHYQRLMETVRLHRTGDTNDNWTAATLDTQLATIVTHSVSALMIENMIVSVGFHSTNLTLNGQLDTRLWPGGQAVTTADMRQYYTNFVRRFEAEVMPDITMNGTIPVDLVVHADLNGETRIDLSINGGPHEVFVTPSFCDALMAPVVTTNNNDYNGLVAGIEEIVNYCGLTSNSQMSMMSSGISTNV